MNELAGGAKGGCEAMKQMKRVAKAAEFYSSS